MSYPQKKIPACPAIALAFILIGAAAQPLSAQSERIIQTPERGYVSIRPAERWEDGLMTGNGNMGAMVQGYPVDDTIVFSHAKLFLPWWPPIPPVETGSRLAELRKMIADGRYKEAADWYVALSKTQGYGEKRWTDPIIPAFDLRIVTGASGHIRRYGRTLDFATGVASVGWKDLEGVFVRRLFVSRADNVAVLLIQGPGPGKLDCRLWLSQRPSTPLTGGEDADYWKPGDKLKSGVGETVAAASGRWLTYRSRFRRTWPGGLQGYEGIAGIFAKGGTVEPDRDSLIVKGADEALVLVRISLLKDWEASQVETVRASLEQLAPAGYEALLAAHAKLHGGLFNRTRFDLGGGADHALPSEDLKAKSRIGALNKAWLEKTFDFSRYATISATGDWPPSLQGPWTGTWGAPWSGDYTHDANTYVSLSSMLSANMPELLHAFFRYMDEFMPDFRTNARVMFGARGIHVPSRMTTHGLDNHFDAAYPITFWTAAAGWMARFYHEYWLYTGDREFLAKRAVLFMKEAALFYEDFLYEGPDGKYVFNPSYMPEDPPEESTFSATMDLAVAKQLLAQLIEDCRALEIEKEGIRRWTAMLKKMPDYQLTPDGLVNEWLTPKIIDFKAGWELTAVMDRIPPDIAADPKLLAAFHRTFDRLLEGRRNSYRAAVLWNATLAQMASALRKAEAAYEILDWTANDYFTASLTTTHDPGQVFNIDVCGGLPDMVIRLLMQSEPGSIDLLPLLPAGWPKGRIEGVLARGRITVRSLAWEGKTVAVTLTSPKAQTLAIRLPAAVDRVSVKQGPGKVASDPKFPDAFRLDLPAGQDVTLEIALR
jgi:hypothetical protein